MLEGLEGALLFPAVLVSASIRTMYGFVPTCENTGQKHAGFFLSLLSLAEIIHWFSFWNFMANGLTIAIGLSCFPSTSSLLSTVLSRYGEVSQNGQGAATLWGPP